MPYNTASNPRHIIHGSQAAFVMASGVPTNFKFNFGTWRCADTVLGENFGVINNYRLASIGEESALKDGGGSTFAQMIMDPGWEITGELLHAVQTDGTINSPQRGGVIIFREAVERNRGTSANQPAVVKSVEVGWEKEGWQMLNFKAEYRESMAGLVTHGVTIDEASLVKRVIYNGTPT